MRILIAILDALPEIIVAFAIGILITSLLSGCDGKIWEGAECDDSAKTEIKTFLRECLAHDGEKPGCVYKLPAAFPEECKHIWVDIPGDIIFVTKPAEKPSL